ncbi:pleckstrin homology domain-containing family A member 5-like isoform X22 [Carassius auratus]|uniref:Pleckstrin homology domain-containing family A member 5-like isoform X22 n=1 Tax=Carassius auratus TaxID=7957 RepID=A0A6P6LGS3_CARAU|nr:pleckstrin homology domain-containing family A member 5-like isoform X22 [Carassius auratus]
MAADLNPDWLSCLPSSWSYGVTRDGRVFFINEEAKSTTWLHPVTGEAVITGHRKTPDLPTGWEEGYTFEGARCFINHNERKVTCKHPVTGVPSQDNCIFVVNEQPASKAPAAEKKERPTSTMSEASNYTGGSDYTTHPSSPTTRLSRSSKKVHNFGKRSNSIKRNPNAPVVKNGWLYKQDSTGMKMWKKRWFVLSDMCLFYYRDEKEEGILGSILLPSFHISMLSVDDHITRKYAFKATHPNMRTYYFSTDTAKDMESWMKVMTDAALVHSEPIRRLDKVKVDSRSPQEMNNMLNHRVLTRPEIQNNERNRETLRQEEKKQKAVDKQKEKDSRVSVQKDGERYTLQRDMDNYTLHSDAQRLALQQDGDRFMLQKDVDKYVLQKDGEKYAVHKDGEKYLLQKDGQKYTLHKDGDKFMLQREGEKYAPPKDSEKILQRETRFPHGDKHMKQKDPEKPVPPPREGEKYGFQKEGTVERPLTKINSIKLQPAQAAAIAAAVSSSRKLQSAVGSGQYKPAQVNGSGERGGDRSPGDMSNTMPQRTTEPERTLSRTNSMQQLEQWVRTHRTRTPDDDTRSITSYQTLPRNMPSHRAQIVPRYPEGYRTLPRNMLRPDSICSVSGSMYDRALQPTSAEKRRSMRDDTMWQLYEWQQRQAHSRIGYGTLPSPKTMSQIAESIPTSPSHGSLAGYHTFSPNRPLNPDSRSEVSSPVFRGDVTIERRHRPHLSKYSFPAERRPVPPSQSITAQSLQGKTPEELTLLLIKLRRQQAELNSLREHTLAQLMQLNLDAANPKSEILSHHLQRNLMYLDSQMSSEEYRENTFLYRPEELDIDAKLSRLCEQDKVVRNHAEKLQQLHREKHTLETALLSASQEIEMSAEDPAAVQSVIQQRDVLQSGLLSTCRELSRVSAELERSWREYDRLEADATLAKTNLLEQLEALGSPQTEPPSQKHVQIQKELWRIQDVMEALNKNKPKRNTEPSFPGANPLSNLHKSEGPDYRLYKSEPELTTVAEVDESNGEDKSEQTAEKEPLGVTKGVVYPVGVVSPRTKSPMPESSTIASYVTLRKSKKPDPRTSQPQERPRSAVDHMSSAVEVGRTRMSVEEQMERIRRHQQGALRERRREDGSLSRSLSFTKDNLYYTLQTRKKSPVISPDEQDTSPEEQPQLTTKPTDAEDNCRNTDHEESGSDSLENKETAAVSRSASIKENEDQSEPRHTSPLEYSRTLATQNSLQTAVMVRVGTEEDEEEEEEDEEEEEEKPSSQEQDVSYDLSNSKHSTLMSVSSLSTPPQSPSSSSSPPPPPSPPQLTDGSHFMCV